jgi:hypothetical protein
MLEEQPSTRKAKKHKKKDTREREVFSKARKDVLWQLSFALVLPRRPDIHNIDKNNDRTSFSGCTFWETPSFFHTPNPTKANMCLLLFLFFLFFFCARIPLPRLDFLG